PGRREDALGWSRLASAALIGEYTFNPSHRLIRCGIIGLTQDRTNGRTSFRKAFDPINGQDQKYPAAAFSLVNLSGSGTRTLASIYNILGLMGKLLTLTEKSAWEMSAIEGEEKKKEDVFNQLLGFFPNTNTVEKPVWIKTQDSVQDEAENEDLLSEQQKKLIEAWVEPLYKWLKSAAELKASIAPSSVMVGKVMPHLFYGLQNISDSLRANPAKDETDFASAMELFALCVVNAFLAEESAFHLTEKGDPIRFILNNPKTSAFNYLKRLNAKANYSAIDRARLPLTTIIATCPLITGLISKEKSDQTWPFFPEAYQSNTMDGPFISAKMWEQLTGVSIAGSNKKDKTQK
ncbi:MAG: hypothetical protein R3317_04245, partial [Burkholderiaceae bacterium]|nr:hypothetical protein [Burkholderiaceae bacterium]